MIELAFNARLLDVVGGLATPAQVEHIEQWGRLISGTAAALLVLGLMLGRAAKSGRSPAIFKIVVACGITVAAVYWGQRALVDHLVENSSAEQRRRAAVLVPVNHIITSQGMSLSGMDLSVKGYNSPEGKTFLAMFPLLASFHPELFGRLDGNATTILQLYAVKRRGDEAQFHKLFIESQKKVCDDVFGKYQDAVTKYNQEVSPARLFNRQNEAWSDYKNKLARKRWGMTPQNIPPRHWGRVRSELRNEGLDLPSDWKPSDRGRFILAVDRRVRSEALREFRSKSAQAIGEPVDPGMNCDQLLTVTSIQTKWQSALQIPRAVRLTPNMSVEQFALQVYEPAIKNDVDSMRTERFASANQYGGRGRFAKIGKENVRALIVPPIALTFSLLGAITHIFKVLAFLVKAFVRVPTPVYVSAFMLYMFAVAVIPMTLTNQVTSQLLFKNLNGYMQAGIGGMNGLAASKAITWTTQFQTYFYPVNELVRTKVLAGATYGYAGNEDQSLQPDE